MTYSGKRGKTAFHPHGKGITFAPAPDPTSPMGRATLEDGTRFRTYPYVQEFVRPLVPDEFEGRQVVSPERMKQCTHIFVTRIEPTSVARTRIPITTEQADLYHAFRVLEKEELHTGNNNGPFSLPEETHHLSVTAAAHGMLAAFQDYPQYVRDEAVVEARAQELADLRVRILPALSNDQELYLRVFVRACVFGYFYGQTTVEEASGPDRTMLLERVCFQPPLDAQNTIVRVLQARLQELQVTSIYDLR